MVKPPKVCSCCGSQLKSAVEEYFCDYCKEKIPDPVHLHVTTFWKNLDSVAQDNEFCSWKCVFNFLRYFKYTKSMVSFVNLPDIGGGDMEFLTEYESFMQEVKKE